MHLEQYFTLDYFGLDYLSSLLVLLAMFYLGNKKRAGFLLQVAATFFGFAFGLMIKSPPIMVMNVLMCAINLRGYWLWKQ